MQTPPKNGSQKPTAIIIILVVLCICLTMTALLIVGWGYFASGPISTDVPNSQLDKTYLGLRDIWFTADVPSPELCPKYQASKVWGVVFDVGLDKGKLTLVASCDNTTSFYFSNGSAHLGLGEDAEISRKSKELIALTEKHLNDMTLTTDHPLPPPNSAYIYALGFDGVYVLKIDRFGNPTNKYADLMVLEAEIVNLAKPMFK